VTYLAVFESDAWRLDRDVLVRALAQDWPEAEVTLATPGAAGSEVRDVEWRYPSGPGDLEGYAHADGRGVYLEGPLDIVADFVVWYRGLVPAGHQVVFCDDSYSFDGIVPLNARREDVMAIPEQTT
jgi:hypothetical protein